MDDVDAVDRARPGELLLSTKSTPSMSSIRGEFCSNLGPCMIVWSDKPRDTGGPVAENLNDCRGEFLGGHML